MTTRTIGGKQRWVSLWLIVGCALPVGAYCADAPDGTARIATVSRLDLRPPDLRSLPWTHSLPAPVPEDADEEQATAVVGATSLPQDPPDTALSLVGIGSLYWAARHPAQAWRVLLPLEPDHEFAASADSADIDHVFFLRRSEAFAGVTPLSAQLQTKSAQHAPETLPTVRALQRFAQDFPDPGRARPLVQSRAPVATRQYDRDVGPQLANLATWLRIGP